MYYEIISQFSNTLKNLDKIMEKAQAYATARGFSADNFLGERLFPDMLPFAAQVRIACDQAKSAAANVSGKEAPKHEDNETSFEELRGRIGKCLAFLASFSAADFATVDAEAAVPMARPKGKAMRKQAYLVQRQMPNFHFHVMMVYALLRKGGVEIGKSDYLGNLPMFDL
jgi:uncharacterized protein